MPVTIVESEIGGYLRNRLGIVAHRGGSRYRWADIGLDPDALRERAKEYQDHFGVPSEPVT